MDFDYFSQHSRSGGVLSPFGLGMPIPVPMPAPAPVYAADLVAFGGRVTLGIADACPVTADLSLPEPYVQTAARLRADMLDACPTIEPRPLPEWGEAILSPEACVCVGPPKEDYPEQSQAVAFAEYAAELHAKHLQLVAETMERPFVAGEEHGGSARERLAAQVLGRCDRAWRVRGCAQRRRIGRARACGRVRGHGVQRGYTVLTERAAELNTVASLRRGGRSR